MKVNLKVTIALLVVLLLGSAYLIGSYVATAQMGKQAAEGSGSSDPMAERIAQALEQMAQAMQQMTGHMSMGSSSGMGAMTMEHTNMMNTMGSMDAMHSQMQGMMPNGQQGMASMGQHAPAPTEKLSESDLMRASAEAGITIEATWMNPLLEPQEALVFRIALDTHSEELLQYDLPALAVVRDRNGQVLAATFVWKPESESDHHRAGILKAQAADQSLLAVVADGVVLELKDIGVPLRRFEWRAAE